jgi:hypothetical protein
MGRDHSFVDREFGRPGYDPYDQGTFERDLVFVGMPFRDDMDDVFGTVRNACKELSLTAVRVDETIAGSGFVIRDITHLIERAEFLIFDLTHERQNVYYELGYAHGVGNEATDILLVAKEGTTIHFDSAPLRVRFYNSLDHLRDTVAKNLREMIRITRR